VGGTAPDRLGTLRAVRVLPLSLVSAGLVLVGLDLRIVHVDLLPDALGWGLVALGAWRLDHRAAAAAGAVAALAALPDAALSFHWEDLDPITGEVVVDGGGTAYDQRIAYDLITDVRAPLTVLALVAGGLALVVLLGRLEQRAVVLGDRPAANQLLASRLGIALLWVFPHVVVMLVQWQAGDGLDPVWSGGLELVAMVGLAVVAAVVVVVARNRNRGWTATDAERSIPWAVRPRRSWA
jgi:hypothetical protein